MNYSHHLENRQNALGSLFIFLSAAAGALLPVVSNRSAIALHPFWIAASSTIIALVPLSILLIARGRWGEFRSYAACRQSAYAGLIIGVGYYGLVYWGCFYTSPHKAAVIFCLEPFGTILMLRKMRHELLTRQQLLGTSLMVGSSVIVFAPTGIEFGDVVLLLSNFVSPWGNLFMKRARQEISAVTILWIRMIVASLGLTFLALVFAGNPDLHSSVSNLWPLLINGVLVLGLGKILWIEGLHRVAIARATAIGASTPFLTYVLAWLLLGQLPSIAELAALPIVIVGMCLLMVKARGTRAD